MEMIVFRERPETQRTRNKTVSDKFDKAIKMYRVDNNHHMEQKTDEQPGHHSGNFNQGVRGLLRYRDKYVRQTSNKGY